MAIDNRAAVATAKVSNLKGRTIMSLESGDTRYYPPGLHPTDVKGIFAFGSPPEGFNPNTATRAALLRYGFPQRPTKRSNSQHRVAWERLFGQSDRQFRRVRTTLESDRRHGGSRGARNPKAGDDNSGQAWAALVMTGGAGAGFGTFTVPGAVQSGATSGFSFEWLCSVWLGLDGYNQSQDPLSQVSGPLQTGIDIEVGQGLGGPEAPFTTTYFPWIEWVMPVFVGGAVDPYLHPKVVQGLDIHQGDVISLNVYYIDFAGGFLGQPPGQYGNLSIYNETTDEGASFLIPIPSSGAVQLPIGQTLEWVVESPGGGAYAPPNFGTITFEHVGGCVPPVKNGRLSPPDLTKATSLIMSINNIANGVALVTPALGATPNSIVFTYVGP